MYVPRTNLWANGIFTTVERRADLAQLGADGIGRSIVINIHIDQTSYQRTTYLFNIAN